MPIPWIDLRTLQYQEYTEAETARGSVVLTWNTKFEFQGTIQPFFPPHMRHLLQNQDEGMVKRVSHICLCNLTASSSSKTPVNVVYGQRIVDPQTGVQYRVEDSQNAGDVSDHLEIPLMTIVSNPSPSGD